jgi:hypothetical protein
MAAARTSSLAFGLVVITSEHLELGMRSLLRKYICQYFLVYSTKH